MGEKSLELLFSAANIIKHDYAAFPFYKSIYKFN